MPSRNPSEKECWRTCFSCFKCSEKGRYSHCYSCSGRNDPMGRLVPDPDVYCDCRNGVLRHQTQSGRVIVRRFKTNPFKSNPTFEAEKVSADERDWEAYLKQAREVLDDPYFDPIRFNDGTSTDAWTKEQRGFGAN